jgi:hypothetical protein
MKSCTDFLRREVNQAIESNKGKVRCQTIEEKLKHEK